MRWVNNDCKLNELTGLWETQGGCLLFPKLLENPLFWFLHSFILGKAFKMMTWVIAIRGEMSIKLKTKQNNQSASNICQIHNPEKLIFVSSVLKPPRCRPFEHLPAARPHSIVTKYGLSVCPCYCMHVFPDGLKPFSTTRPMLSQWEGTY